MALQVLSGNYTKEETCQFYYTTNIPKSTIKFAKIIAKWIENKQNKGFPCFFYKIDKLLKKNLSAYSIS